MPKKICQAPVVSISIADIENREENFILSITSDIGDIINMIFSTRGEPFDGVNETLNIQQGELIAKIDDFQRMKIWHKDFYKHYKFWPKDVGHAKSVTQMFKKNPDYLRPWSETYLSTAFMLHISDMVRDNVSHSKFSFDKFLLNLNKKLEDIKLKQIYQNVSSGETSVEEVPRPQCKKGHVLIKSTYSLISAGTERMLVDFGKSNFLDKARKQPEKVSMVLDKLKTDGIVATYDAVKTKLDQPLPMGYSNVGVVEEVGEGVNNFSRGDRVVSNGKSC